MMLRFSAMDRLAGPYLTVTIHTHNEDMTLVIGGTGKTGRRIVKRLRERGLPVRSASRAGEPPSPMSPLRR